MSIEQLIAAHLRLRKELIPAFGSEPWKSCRAGHIQHLSAQIGCVEDELQRYGSADKRFVGLIAGNADLEHAARQ